VLATAGFSRAQTAPLHGGRRALRFQPQRVELEIAGGDLILSCDLDEEAYSSVLLEELIQPEGHLQ
jgi:tRNA(Glu) U13 pseudouridine synthase TruD